MLKPSEVDENMGIQKPTWYGKTHAPPKSPSYDFSDYLNLRINMYTNTHHNSIHSTTHTQTFDNLI